MNFQKVVNRIRPFSAVRAWRTHWSSFDNADFLVRMGRTFSVNCTDTFRPADLHSCCNIKLPRLQVSWTILMVSFFEGDLSAV